MGLLGPTQFIVLLVGVAAGAAVCAYVASTIARLAVGAIQPDDVNTRRRQGELAKTISRRWADLVDDWTSN